MNREENKARVQEALLTRAEIPESLPLEVFLEPSSGCNLSCPLCPNGSRALRRTRTLLDVPLAERLCDEVGAQVETFGLGFFGEPLLHPDIARIVAAAGRQGALVRIYTNLTITPKGGFERLIESGLGHVVVSVDGVTQESYGSYRKDGRLATVLDNVRALRNTRERLCARGPVIELQMLDLRSNAGEWEPFVVLCRDLGVDVAKWKRANTHPGAPATSAEMLPVRSSHSEGTESREICRELYVGPAIVTAEGRFALCCRDHEAAVFDIDARGTSIWDFWNGPELGAIRRAAVRGGPLPPICTDCPSLRMNDVVLARSTLGLSLPAPNSASVLACQGLHVASVRTHVKAVPLRGDFPAPPAVPVGSDVSLEGLPHWAVAHRTFTDGQRVDYGSYRTFRV